MSTDTGIDYVADALTANIPPIMSGYIVTVDFNITTIDDSVVEETESFTLSIAPSQPLNIATLNGFVAVLDDDGEMYLIV